MSKDEELIEEPKNKRKALLSLRIEKNISKAGRPKR